ncbi:MULTISPECIES: winged helix-turn-helix domain-containing protein [Streptomyces]|uniref:Winged helix-turn-helix transcriptional regulator n=1 Tax=Streptomyces lycii TaxID=2654337 RepID=A0ABQ7FDT0_9ACTN|nr:MULTISPECIES: winged helix-turn-helix domain-containing protein [Streptomyces]KAF4406810.1 winged helix-turn-helix transcriptional regulator [Streptomyces lycii]PGH49877.1 transcriptional regulator [Streptomyces sp. Ru87]
MTSEELLALLAAVGHAQRLRIVGELAQGRLHVSELARRLGLSRPLLYMHLERLEKAGLVAGALELSADGKAMKFFELLPFDIHVTVDTVLTALREDQALAAGAERGTAEKGKRT